MKKFSIVFPVLLLVCAGLVMVSCPSDPPPPISDADIEIKGGKYQYLFDDPLIEHDNEYEVIFTIEDCDESFVGKRLGGKICYKMDLSSDDEKVLSGWANAVPPTVSRDVQTYIWTFKAGKANADSVTIEDPATTPTGGKQYFSFTAQDGYTDSKDDFNVKGGFEIKAVETITNWESEGTLTLGSIDSATGKGTLNDADMAKIRALPPRSKIVFTVSVTVNNSDARPGYGVCGVGGWQDSNSISIPIPSTASPGALEFTADIKVSDILALSFSGNISINPYNGASVTKAELFKPKT